MAKDKEQLIPGLTVSDAPTVNPDSDLADIRRRIAREEAASEEAEVQRKSGLLETIKARLLKGLPIKMTKEMEELQIEEAVTNAAWEAHTTMKFNQMLERGFSNVGKNPLDDL